jgi:hypothetical protein
MSKAHLLASCAIGLAAFLLAPQCQAQGNLDRGKTPAQAFADTCAACHRSPRALKRTSAAFLRAHYVVSSAEASAMAAYLAGFPSDPAQRPKGPPANGAETRAEATKQQARQQPIAGTADRAQTASSQPGGERLDDVIEVRPAPRQPQIRPWQPTPSPRPVLEPFEE